MVGVNTYTHLSNQGQSAMYYPLYADEVLILKKSLKSEIIIIQEHCRTLPANNYKLPMLLDKIKILGCKMRRRKDWREVPKIFG